jgi:hypothetical protein
LVWAEAGRNNDNNRAETKAVLIGRKITDSGPNESSGFSVTRFAADLFRNNLPD